ncbi:MAG: hypothetical protein ACOX5Z_00290 [Desulfobulbus sp.]
MNTALAGTGRRKRLVIDGENYYLVVTSGPDGPHVCCTCPRENAPDNLRMRAAVDALCIEITSMLRTL